MPLDDALHHLQHRRDQLRLCDQQHAQRNGQPKLTNSHPLPHRHVGDDVVHQVRRRLRHPACTAQRAEAAPLATEGQQLGQRDPSHEGSAVASQGKAAMSSVPTKIAPMAGATDAAT